jgi:hypothetical protein
MKVEPQAYQIVPTIGGRVQRHPVGIVGGLFRVDEPETIRVGNCWMAGRLLQHDLILCLRHAGDCFQIYILVKEYDNALEGIVGSRWGAYGYGNSERIGTLTDEELRLLGEGGILRFPTGTRPPPMIRHEEREVLA